MNYLFLSIFILLFGAVLSLFLKDDLRLKISTFFTGISALPAAFIAVTTLVKGVPDKFICNFSPLFGPVTFVLDPLSAIFILIIAVMSLLGVIYSNGYLRPYIGKNKNLTTHSFFIKLLIASMYGVTVVQNGLFFLVIWELMSLSSFFLVLFEGEKKEVRKSAIKYLVYMHLSVIFLIAMFAILANNALSFDFADYAEVLATNSQLANIVFILGFIGFGIKAGFVPFHNWLPDAHPAAPSNVSGMMSGIMIKTGIYGILRILYLTGTPTKCLAFFVLTIAAITVLYGVLYAITQHDIKRLLAYSSIENIGIIGLGIGVGMLGLAYSNPVVAIFGFAGGIFHILNHSIFKELLFFTAGSIYLKTHTRNIESLGGLIKKMPYTSTMFIIACVAICGLPPLNGFVGEILIYAGMLLGIPASEIGLFLVLVISIAVLALAGTMAIVCFSKASGITLLGEARSEKAQIPVGDVEEIMLMPMWFLAGLTLLLGLFPQIFVNLVLSPVYMFINKPEQLEIFNSVIDLVQILSMCFFVLLVILSLVCLFRRIINHKSTEHTTWGCGYDRPNTHMQYTPSSYDNLFVSTLKPLFKRISNIKKPKELFPKEAYFELEIEDIEEAYIVEPIIKLDEKILSQFERIQNGNMQQYILFGLLFLVIAIIGLVIFGG